MTGFSSRAYAGYKKYIRWVPVLFLVFIFSEIFILGLNTYWYGINDQVITIPFVKVFSQPALYPHDYVMQERIYYYTILWNSLGFLVRHFNMPIPSLFFFLHCVTIYMIFLGVFFITRELFGRDEVAYLALFFILFSNSTLASEFTLENQFLTKNAAIAFVLFGVYFFMKEKYYLAFSALGAGFLMHPISAVCVLCGLSMLSIFKIKEIGVSKLLLCMALLLSIMSPLIIWSLLAHPNTAFFLAPPEWVKLLRWRSAHIIFPFSWGRELFLKAGLSVLLFGISLKYQPREKAHSATMWIVTVIFACCIIGTIFSEFIPVAIILKMQLLRNFKFFLYFVMMYFAHYFLREMELAGNILRKIVAVFFSLGIFWGAKDWAYGYTAFILFALFLIVYKALYRHSASSRASIVCITILSLLLGSMSLSEGKRLSINNAQETNWLDVQYWARQNTNKDDIFIVPPDLMGFRVESERTVYCEFKDGTLMNFNPDFGYEWARRIKGLGCNSGKSLRESFKNLTEKDFLNIAAGTKEKQGRCFLVMYKEMPLPGFPEAYKNSRFRVYEVVSPR